MKINQSPTFNGIKISQTNIMGHRLDVYKLTDKDRDFITQLSTNIDLKKLIPNISNDEFEIYNNIIKRSFDKANYQSKSSMLLACDDKPCSIIVTSKNRSEQIVDYICSWPIEPKQKAPFGAQTLFTQIYKDFLNTDLKFIELQAIRFGSAISKYMQLGFTSRGGNNFVEIMRISKDRVLQYYQKLKEKINLTPSGDNTDIDLFTVLK